MKKGLDSRKMRHVRLRRNIAGTKERPRVCVHRALGNLSAQLIDDEKQMTIAAISTFSKGVKDSLGYGGNVKAAEKLGELFAEKIKASGISAVVFDRGGYIYHGRVKAFADALRKGGIKF